MPDSETTLYALAALCCFAAVGYGLWTYSIAPTAELTDVLPTLFAAVPGSVAARRALAAATAG